MNELSIIEAAAREMCLTRNETAKWVAETEAAIEAAIEAAAEPVATESAG